MTPKQKKLAREALGLPNRRRTSCRNFFVAARESGGPSDTWFRMVDAGYAVSGRPYQETIVFHLTPPGALQVLEEGEALDPDDFPDVPPA
jgi:hypothetical protein